MSSTSTNTARQAEVDRVVAKMRQRADKGVYRGRMDSATDMLYFRHCRRMHLGLIIIFTRDIGYHTCGWWKNPEYERCWHLSMSVAPSAIWTPGTPEVDRALELMFLKGFFREHLHKVWTEPPYSPEGKARNVWHWRLFADQKWNPIIPRGEVYTRTLTELGWKTASEVLHLEVEGIEEEPTR